MKSALKFCIFAAGLALGQAVLAQASPVSSQLLAQRVELVAGKPVLKPAGDGKPGDVLQYSATYRNTSAAAADKLLATVPVPPGTTLIAASADPALALASTDGNVFAPMPLTRMVKQADGSVRKEPVPLADYRALRWEIGTLAAGASTVVSLRVRIDSPAAVPAAKP
ncbi:hypothetical protein [Polaromonas sp.]|uniref:hypothetical protein n=1 Tax=Polaromonas sp. TaxID=1869339 RepID=UPI00326774A9